MNNFTFTYPTKNYFGVGCVNDHLPTVLDHYGKNVLLAYGGGSIKKNGIYDQIMTLLHQANKTVIEFNGIMPNPTYAKVQEGATLAKTNAIDLIIAVGGGSVIDCCKIVSAQAKCDQDIWEMEFQHHQYPTHFIPLIAIVTASGTGAEQNNGAVITNAAKKIKAGVVGAYADIAFLDPRYTLSLPMSQVISGAFDTLSHCMETYFGTPNANNLSDDINESVMRRVIKNMQQLLVEPMDITVRSELEWASAMAENGILKIGKRTVFQAHQIEHQLGAYTDCNHGQGLAVIHPVMYRQLLKSDPSKFARFATNVWMVEPTNKTALELANAGIDALEQFIKTMGLPTSFHQMGIKDDVDYRAIADSTNIITTGCFTPLTADEIYSILLQCR